MKKQELIEEFRQITPDIDYCQRFLKLATDDEIDDLPHLGLILIAPESFALGVADQLIDRISRSGFVALDLTVADPLTEDEVAAMFIPGWIPERYRFWLIQRRFMMGPTAAIAITHHETEDIADSLKRRKGFRIPAQAEPGTWRAELPSINGVLNLLHTADSPAYVLRNAAPFFSAERHVRALRKVNAIRSGAEQGLDWEDLKRYGLAGYQAGYQSGTRKCGSFFEVYFGLLQRLLSRQWERTPHQLFVAAHAQIAKVLHSSVEGDLRGGTQTTFAAIAAVAKCTEYCESHVAHLIRLLTQLDQAYKVAWDRVLPQLQLAGVSLDRWEELILLTTLYYTDQELSQPLLAACREHRFDLKK
jgi:hypothetical protein